MGRLKTVTEMIGIGEVKKLSLYKAVGAEFLGSLFLVLIGCGACLGQYASTTSSITRIALTFGLTVATLVQALSHVSGCHINPAVTAGMLVGQFVSAIRAVLYIIAQMVGAMTGAAILYGLVPSDYRGSLGNTAVGSGVTVGQAFGIELMITFVLVLTVFGVCDERRKDIKGSAALAIGLSITACHLFAIPFTGSSMNPARSFGPAVIMGGDYWDYHWVYWVGPLSGGVLAGLMYTYLFREKKSSNASDDTEIGRRDRY